jgi:hypothetical protein
MTEGPRRKRGRPRLASWDEIVGELLNVEDAARADAMGWVHRWATRDRGGRPEDRDLNQKLLEGANEARRHGISLRAFCKSWFANEYGREPTLEDVKVVERRINRQRARNKKSLK